MGLYKDRDDLSLVGEDAGKFADATGKRSDDGEEEEEGGRADLRDAMFQALLLHPLLAIVALAQNPIFGHGRELGSFLTW